MIITVDRYIVFWSALWYPSMTAILPNPPPPITPAIAVYDTSEINVSVRPLIIAGNASGINILNIIWQGVAPIESPISIKPLSTSFIAFSIILATNGTLAIESGIKNAVVPYDLPTSSLDNGINRTISITNGIDLVILTNSTSSILWYILFSHKPPFLVVINDIPNGIPNKPVSYTHLTLPTTERV